jgi:hypothetical protein
VKPARPTRHQGWIPKGQSDRFEDRIFSKELLVSHHYCYTTFERCAFEETDLSNSCFEGSHFINCSFRRVLLCNARLVDSEFQNCYLEDIDLAGALLDRMRLWFPNTIRNAQADAWTHLQLPLPEENEFSYELAARNYRIYRDMFSGSGRRGLVSTLSFREQKARSHIWPSSLRRFRSLFISIITGYGERPFRFASVLLFVIFAFAFSYWKFHLLVRQGSDDAITFFEAFYFSVVTFSTLGFGDITPQRVSYGQSVVILEVFSGIVGIAVFTALVVRRYFQS